MRLRRFRRERAKLGVSRAFDSPSPGSTRARRGPYPQPAVLRHLLKISAHQRPGRRARLQAQVPEDLLLSQPPP